MPLPPSARAASIGQRWLWSLPIAMTFAAAVGAGCLPQAEPQKPGALALGAHPASGGSAAASPLAAEAPPGPEAMAHLVNPQVQSWMQGQIAGAKLHAAQLARRQAMPPAEGRKLLAFGDAGAWAGGINLAALGVSGHATNGACFLYGGHPNTRNRIWTVTTTGILVGLDGNDPLNVAGVAGRGPITLNLGDTVSFGFVSASFDSARLYVVSDNRQLHQINLASGSPVRTTVAVPVLSAPGGTTSMGVAAALDPLLCTATKDVLFVANNAGEVTRFESLAGGAPTTGTTRNGVGITQAMAAPLTRLMAAPAFSLNGLVIYGDRGGNMNVLNHATGALTVLPTGTTFPIESAVAIQVDDNLNWTDLFATAGARVAWHQRSSGTTSLSRPLLVDQLGGGGRPNEGLMRSFTPANVSATVLPLASPNLVTALVTPDPLPSGLNMVLPQKDDLAAVISNVRDRSLTYAHRVPAGAAISQSVYGTPNLCGPQNGQILERRSAQAGVRSFGAILGMDLTDAGHMWVSPYLDQNSTACGGGTATFLNYIPGSNTNVAPLYGYAGPLLEGRSYLVAGRSNVGPVAAPLWTATNPSVGAGAPVRVVHMPATGDVFTTNYNSNNVTRLRPNGQWVLCVNLPQPHAIAAVGTDLYVMGEQNGNDDSRVLKRLRLADNYTVKHNVVDVFATTGVHRFTGMCYDAPRNHLYLCSRHLNRVVRVDLATNTATLFLGGGASRVSGASPLAFQLSGPEALAVHPTTGDLYVGEQAGARLWRVYANTPANGSLANTVTLVAGNGSTTYGGNGLAGPNQGLGWLSALKFGPTNLNAPAVEPYAKLYALSRDTNSIISFSFPGIDPGGARGLMRWDYSGTAALANKPILDASVQLTISSPNPTAVPYPEVVLASPNLSGSATLWSNTNVTLSNVPALDTTVVGTKPGSALVGGPYTVGQKLTYTLPAPKLPTNGHLALAITPPVVASPFPSPGQISQDYPFADGALTGSTQRLALSFYGRNDGGVASNRASLALTVANRAMARPVLSPPALFDDGAQRYVCVFNTNALFRLSYNSVASFTGAADTVTYAAGTLARANPTVAGLNDGGGFLANPTPPLLTLSGMAYGIEQVHLSPGNQRFGLVKNNIKAASGAILLGGMPAAGITTSLAANDYLAATYATYDSFGGDGGNLYFGLGNGRMYRFGM